MTVNTGHDRQVKRRRKKAKLADETAIEELRKLLQIPAFRKFYWSILEECGVYQVSFTGNSTTFFNEGRRSIGLWAIARIMETDPTAYGLIRVEAEERAKKVEYDEEDAQVKEDTDDA